MGKVGRNWLQLGNTMVNPDRPIWPLPSWLSQCQCNVWHYTPLPDYTRVDCGRPRMYPGVDPELFPRGRLRWLPESTSPSQDLPPFIVILCEVYSSPRIYPSLPEYTPFLTTICNPLRIYPSFPEYTPLFNNYNIMRPSQNLPLSARLYSPFQPIYMCDPTPPPPGIYPCLPESIPFPITVRLCNPPRICPSLPEYFSVLGASGRFSHN